jgi:glycosyltransferase involved in cell wall biosynthesis
VNSGRSAVTEAVIQNDVLGLTWFEHRRTRVLTAGLGVELAVVDTTHRGLRRYLLLTARTLRLLARRRPRILLVQNPSLVLSILTVLLRPFCSYRLVIDAHNEAVEPYENPQSWIRWLSRWVIRSAHLVIVTNRQLADAVQEQGGTAFVLPDKVPAPPSGAVRRLGDRFSVVLIATFARDEPVAAIMEAVRGLDLDLFVTGNTRKLGADLAAVAPPNVHFTGFLAEADYWSTLRAADAIVDLTLKADCLVCGAYEALALGKPLLLSRNTAGVELFGDAVEYTDNSAPDIRRALQRLRAESAQLQLRAEKKRAELAEQWSGQAIVLAQRMRDGGA